MQGTHGDFAPQSIFQSARPSNVSSASAYPNGACNNANGNDVSLCNQAASTYGVSQDTIVRSALAKFRYSLSPVTNLTGTVYSGIQWADSTGNGDNDFLPYNSRLAQINSTPGGPNCTTGGGTAGYTVVTDPIANTTACSTPQQWAAASYGPDGGGANRQRGAQMKDYHLLFATAWGANHITVDGFINNYSYWKDSNLSGGVDASGNELGQPDFTNYYNTHGLLIADDLTFGSNDIGFGYYSQNQLQTGIKTKHVAPDLILPQPSAFLNEGSAFIRDTQVFTPQLSLFTNGWLKHSSVTGNTTFDPRISAVLRPDSADVFRLTYGRSDGAPAPSLKLVGQTEISNPGASLTSVSCSGLNEAGSGGNPNLLAESANDIEAGYGHRFKGDSNIQVTGYVTNVTNQLIAAQQPLLSYGIGNVFFDQNALQTYAARLITACGLSPAAGSNLALVYPYLSVATTYNLAHALARGIELSGRQRVSKIVSFDYGYSIESSQQFGLPDDFLQNNPTNVNGGQILGLPLHQATISLDVAPKNWEFRIDNYYVDGNNPLDRPAYWHSNAFISHAFGKDNRTVLTLGGTNIFNNAVQVYGYLGQGVFARENPFFSDSSALAEFVNGNFSAEEFGIAPATLTLTLSQRI